MRDDHLGCEHGFQLIPRADPMKKRQDEVCGRGVEGFRGISVKGVYELFEESLGYNALRCPKRGEESCFEFLDRYRSIEDWFKRMAPIGLQRYAGRGHQCGLVRQRGPFHAAADRDGVAGVELT